MLAAALSACAATPEIEEKTDPSAEFLYNEGTRLARSGSHNAAIRRFEELEKLYPYSADAARALVNLTFLNYENGNYTDSANNARRFLALYPADEDASYMLYLLGQSYFRQIAEISQDQEMAQRALSAFQQLVERDPQSQYAEDARGKIRIARNQLSGKEMSVGRYYLRKGNYGAAINRYRVVVESYPATQHVEEALYRLAEAYYALGIVNEARNAAAVLGHNYPDSPWYQDAYQLLESGGTTPRKDGTSWLAGLFS